MSRTTSDTDPTPGCAWIGAIAIGLVLLIYSIATGVSEMRFHSSGQETTGHVSFAWTTGGNRGRPGIPKEEYEFVVDGKTYDGSTSGPISDSPVIEYLKDDPATNRVKGVGGFSAPGITFAAALVAFGVGLALFMKNDELVND